MVKFVHTADWQIGMKAAHVGSVGEKVRAERLASLRRLVDATRANDADFLVVAGDAFEDNAIDRVLVQKAADILLSLKKPIYIVPGNHDPLIPGSVWSHPAWKSDANLRVLTEPSPYQIGVGTLYPCPVFAKHSQKDPTRWIDARADRGIAVGIAHGTIEGIAQDELDYPIARNAATRAGLDYLALGHWHSTATFADGGGAIRMAYSGTQETTKFGERNSGNVLFVEIPSRGAPPKVTPIRTGRFNWRSMDCDVRDVRDLVRLREEVETLTETDTTLLDLRLAGILHPGDQMELTRIDEIVRSRFVFGRVDTTRLLPRPDDNSWLANVPVGVLRQVAERLTRLSDPAVSTDRPNYATPGVAARSLLELYRAISEVGE